ncbi:MAG: hypothetical protein JW384_02560 [Nitrosomonadaceae bacterium]|nr:hypothetical protein [Nitrosomonadaceae bacterium]
MENSTLHLTTNGCSFAHEVARNPRRLQTAEALALVTAKGDEGCRFVLVHCATASGFANRFYPKSDKFVTNRLKKASYARLAQWAQGKATKV